MSIHPEIADLIQRDIDGVASEAERMRLRDAITADAEVRDAYRSMKGLSDVLARVQPEDPPAHLIPTVMHVVRSGRGAARPGVLDGLRSFWPGGHLALRYGYALAAGAVIGVLGVQLASGGGIFGPVVPERDASATLGPSRAAGRLDLTAAGIDGVATLTPSASGTLIGVDLGTAEPVELVLRYDPAKAGGRVDVLVVRAGEATPAGSLQLPRKR